MLLLMLMFVYLYSIRSYYYSIISIHATILLYHLIFSPTDYLYIYLSAYLYTVSEGFTLDIVREVTFISIDSGMSWRAEG